jgi:hypothetical protein
LEYVAVPRGLYEKVKERGFDLVDLLLLSLSEKLGLDPGDEAGFRLELAERYLEEAKMYVERGDPVQSSEKLYKVAGECVKALAVKFNIPEVHEVRREGRWWAKLLSRAAKTLSLKLEEPLINVGWSVAYDLHVRGFHEAALSIEHVKLSLPHIERLLGRTRELLSRLSLGFQ